MPIDLPPHGPATATSRCVRTSCSRRREASPFRRRRFAVGFAAAVALAGALWPAAAGAITIGFAPIAQDVEVGDVVSVDVVFSELGGEIVSAYDLDITYDSAVLQATDVDFSGALGDELFFEVFDDFDLSAPGVIDMAQLSLLSDDFLFALQGGDEVVVATLSLEAVGIGTSALAFRFDDFNDVKGRGAQVLDLVPGDGSVTVGGGDGQAPVPEPTAALLFGFGLLCVSPALRRRRHRM